tara:strand:+ start:865 stop:1779 length:915 start_codon:yes stop_codon:yes gene_type:complete
MAKKLKIYYANIYITNVCNLNCPGCYYFNNFKYKGHQNLAELKSVYQRWAEELEIERINILGGEPTLHPQFKEWVMLARDTFNPGLTEPKPGVFRSNLIVTTNGTHLNKIPEWFNFFSEQKVSLDISLHNPADEYELLEEIKAAIPTKRTKLDEGDGYHKKYFIVDTDDNVTAIGFEWWFSQGPLIETAPGSFKLHDSDVEIAHSNCVHSVCHTFKDGKLYKCGTVAQFPDLLEQFDLDVSDKDKELMLAYKPLSVDDTVETKKEFIDNLRKSIPQCKFCPEKYIGDEIFAGKGVKPYIKIKSV